MLLPRRQVSNAASQQLVQALDLDTSLGGQEGEVAVNVTTAPVGVRAYR
jgi:hypothetical protein